MGKRKIPLAVPERELTRRELRKERRGMKKKARIIFFENKRNKFRRNSMKSVLCTNATKGSPEVRTNNLVQGQNSNSDKTCENTGAKFKCSHTSSKKAHDKLMNQMKEQRKRQLLEANCDEDKEIRSLEKKLKLTKKKAVSTKGFIDSGLDYILDVCDSYKKESAVQSEINFNDSDSDFYEDYEIIKDNSKIQMGENKKNEDSSKMLDIKKRTPAYSDVSKPLSHTDEENDEVSLYEEIYGIPMDSVQDSSIKVCNEDEMMVREDIYGRLRDQQGNILKNDDCRYVPPHQRHIENSNDMKLKELNRQLKGCLNKLALNNMHSISNQVEDLYSKNIRNALNEALFQLYIDSLITHTASPKSLIIDYAMLIAVLHANIGSEIGAFMLQNIVKKFISILNLPQTIENKELDNLLLLISYLYYFKIFEAILMYDILNKLACQLSEKNIDLILIILKSVGFSLRRDDPTAMKVLLLNVQKQMTVSEAEDRSRMKYMLEILLSIKNNNMSKISDFDPELHEHLKKVIKSVIRSGNSIVPLRISLDDLLKADEKGRWWIIGSAWNTFEEEKPKTTKEIPYKEEFSAKLLALAKKQHMNTDNRRNLFCILMSAEDYQDAFEKILRLGLKGQQEREIPLVIVHCLLQEKKYNPFYAHIADQICLSNRRHQMTLQCALWDRFRGLDRLSSSQINSLSRFLAQIILAGSIPLSVLKVLEFTELDKKQIRLLRQTILAIANEDAKDSVIQVFLRVSKSKKLLLFREALRLFIHHFILRNMPESELREHMTHINSILLGDVS